MKTKSVSVKLCDSFKFPTETNLDQSFTPLFSPQTNKNETIQIASTSSTPKSLQISVEILSVPTKKTLKKVSKLLKSTKITKNPKIYQKKKQIKKCHKIGVQTLITRRKNVLNMKKVPKIQRKSNSLRYKKENNKNSFNKQKIETKTNQNASQHQQTPQIEEKSQKTAFYSYFYFKLEESIQIRSMQFQRRQLQKKREDLLKRNVEDWDMIQKGRSAYRELRSLNN